MKNGLQELNHHQRAITFDFKGPTDYNGSHLAVKDIWHKQSTKLGLSGADPQQVLGDYLEARGFTIISYAWLNQQTTKGVVLVKEFDIRLK